MIKSFSNQFLFQTVIGKMGILPSSFMGCPRAIQQNFLDSMTISENFGKPDLFLTMTCNRHWQEIAENLNSNEIAIDRPDIVTRVFHEKINILKDELMKKNIFGKVITIYIHMNYCVEAGRTDIFAF